MSSTIGKCFSKVGKRAQTEILSQLSMLGFYVSVFKSRKKIANFTQVSDMLSSSDPITTYLSQNRTYFFEESVKNTDLIESNYVMLHMSVTFKRKEVIIKPRTYF